MKISQLVLKLSKLFNKKIVLKKTKIDAGSSKRRCPDIKKIKKLGFKQKFKLDLGLKKTLGF